MPDPDYRFEPALPRGDQDRLCSIAPINVCNGTLTLNSAPASATSAPAPQVAAAQPAAAAKEWTTTADNTKKKKH